MLKQAGNRLNGFLSHSLLSVTRLKPCVNETNTRLLSKALMLNQARALHLVRRVDTRAFLSRALDILLVHPTGPALETAFAYNLDQDPAPGREDPLQIDVAPRP